ncbi:hypothetical protein E2C01_098028 [Portunus trituberculatus]|uniref:Secreted protein n=1 Tax=Portunus trituberculatus TaxID=210409 RepID=A0A5B7K764_PORTR|nr:hypothetical protein [Portunus trituberculatus]
MSLVVVVMVASVCLHPCVVKRLSCLRSRLLAVSVFELPSAVMLHRLAAFSPTHSLTHSLAKPTPTHPHNPDTALRPHLHPHLCAAPASLRRAEDGERRAAGGGGGDVLWWRRSSG